MSQSQGPVVTSHQQTTGRGECVCAWVCECVCVCVCVSQPVTWVDYGLRGALSPRWWITRDGALAATVRRHTVMAFNEGVWCCHKAQLLYKLLVNCIMILKSARYLKLLRKLLQLLTFYLQLTDVWFWCIYLHAWNILCVWKTAALLSFHINTVSPAASCTSRPKPY